MTRATLFALGLALTLAPDAPAKDAKAEAQSLLDKGAALFDKRDADAMAATYTADAQLLIYMKEESGETKVDVKRGRDEIAAFYRDYYKDADPKATSKNVVDSARLLAPDLMVIQGTFQPDTAKPERYPVVQTRVKQGDRWLLLTLQFFVVHAD